jgi:AcrR family transcriptional regulator
VAYLPIPDASRRSKRARAAILEATAELIAAVGYDSMTIEGIAARAGVGKQTIYRWWPSKAAVVLEMWAPGVHPLIEFPDTGDLATDLITQITGVVDLAADATFGPSFRALVAESQYDEALARGLEAQIFGPRIEACKKRLRTAQAAGSLPKGLDLDLAIDLLYGGFYHRYLLRLGPLDGAWVAQVVDHALRGLRYEPGGTSRREKGYPRPRRMHA